MIENRPNVVIVIGKCGRNRNSFGIRLEEKGNHSWEGTWAFPIKDSVAKREQYDKNTIFGGVYFERAYPGCPYCRSMNISKCGRCGKISCWDGRSESVTCAWCGVTLRMGGYIDQIDSSSDR